VVDGIPDFRLSMPSWIDAAEDTATARELAEADLPLPELVKAVYSRQTCRDEERVARRTREVLDGPDRLREDLLGWLKPVVEDGPFLDLGCGGGMLLAAAAQLHPGISVLGIDASMTWLVVAKKFVRERGGHPILAAGLAEALPLADGSIPAIVSLDVVEHVQDPDVYLREIDRVLQVGGRAALSTPNRYSLTAEPHVFVWGVGWLPRRFQRAFVRWRSGKAYNNTTLMSSVELKRRLRRSTRLQFRIIIPTIPDSNIAHFAPFKRTIARLFNTFSQATFLRPLFLCIGPFFRVAGSKCELR
jgi:SAM-dependent methyltransferase